MKALKRSILFIITLIALITMTACNLFEPDSETLETKDAEQDKNIYLFEEACFAGEVYFTVTSMEILEDPNFSLILTIDVEQRNEDRYKNNIDITSDMFTIKSTNNATLIAIGSVYTSILQTGIEAGIGAIFGESSSAIDIMLSAVENYADAIPDIVEEALSSFKIKATKNQFEPFKSRDIEGKKTITVQFDFTEEQLQSDRLIMLEIDDGSKNTGHFKRKIYLIPRPEGNTI